MLPCGGLIHRNEAGLKHCMERFATITTPTSRPTDASHNTGRVRGQTPTGDDTDDDDHFYYFNGVLKKVRQNFYPYSKRQTRQKKRLENTESGVPKARNKRDAHDHLLTYIRRRSGGSN